MEEKRSRRIAPIAAKYRLTEAPKDREYWQQQPYADRIAALEEIRQEYLNWSSHAESGFQRVYTVIKQASGRTQDLADLENLS